MSVRSACRRADIQIYRREERSETHRPLSVREGSTGSSRGSLLGRTVPACFADVREQNRLGEPKESGEILAIVRLYLSTKPTV